MATTKASTAEPKPKRSRKQPKPAAAEPLIELNPAFQKQGMSTAWQQFYAQVKQAVTE
ncbi:hypothetical protein [Tumebacillus permanentifrigoris]|uniref:Uncharacterized protein n=1 Tax=Tumebacillus permanentifrigoris TaxID=378543 RepID=A0A316E122_9BACL|nr:hypothetical protein [Tumebacillus permanentifrigoris]PWK16510.1 hypothetical protein C7459_101376 [Tumebacillus permanentifrigoris]